MEDECSIGLKSDGELQLVVESIKALQAQFIAMFCMPAELGIGSVWSNALFAFFSVAIRPVVFIIIGVRYGTWEYKPHEPSSLIISARSAGLESRQMLTWCCLLFSFIISRSIVQM